MAEAYISSAGHRRRCCVTGEKAPSCRDLAALLGCAGRRLARCSRQPEADPESRRSCGSSSHQSEVPVRQVVDHLDGFFSVALADVLVEVPTIWRKRSATLAVIEDSNPRPVALPSVRLRALPTPPADAPGPFALS